ncbi:MAG: hypothetical protein M1830_009874 [Pleopsidium flavum]|nr:MAG: hypothetical protein M1830_009874 [Pleopsidium flavum]
MVGSLEPISHISILSLNSYGRPGKIYYGRHRELYDDEAIVWFSEKLTGIPKGESDSHISVTRMLINAESTFEAVQGSEIDWQPHDDIINPYGDRRGISIDSVWTLDLDNDMLVLDKNDQTRRLHLNVLRQRPITFEDFEAYEPETIPKIDVRVAFPNPYWNPTDNVLERTEAFVTRILEDFAYQWRHVLRNRYNESTFRKLAWAVIRIAMLDFNVVEEAPRRRSRNFRMVDVHQLPEWKPLDTTVVQIRSVWVVLSQDIKNSLSLIREDYANRKDNGKFSNRHGKLNQSVTYLVLSLRHIMLCNIDDKTLEYTQPEPLFDGTNSPTKGAVKLLLIALHAAHTTTPIDYLPAELQDDILSSVSEGEIEGARIGCILNLGTTFLWKSRDRPLERVESWRNRTTGPLEQQIWFGGCFSGVAYC